MALSNDIFYFPPDIAVGVFGNPNQFMCLTNLYLHCNLSTIYIQGEKTELRLRY